MAIVPLQAKAAERLLVPAYFDPSSGTYWNTLTSSVSPTVPITAIMNPDSGPAPAVDSSYTNAISSFESAGGEVVAYVPTSDGSRSISAVEKDIATYYSEYPNIDGIFLDQMATSSSKLTYYKNIYSYIKTENSTWQVIGNPGTSTLSTYLAPTPAAANELVTFENDTGYSSYTPSAWQASYNASSFANIVYAVPNTAAMQSDLTEAVADNIGNVYFSDLSGTNPYDALPSYWSAEVSAVSLVNNPKETYTAATSGDFNNPANWSVSVPNAIGVEADFLGAILANHTVYSDVPITLGTIVFNNTHSYVLTGAGSLTLQSLSGSAMVEAEAGVQTISLPITLASNTTFSASAGATLVISSPVTVDAGNTLTESGSGTIRLLGSLTLQTGASANFATGSSLQSLTVGSAAIASLVATGSASPSAVVAQSVSLATNSTLNLHGQGLVVPGGDLAQLSGLIREGNLSGKGIIDSTAGANHLTAVAAISNQTPDGALYSTFDQTAIDASDVLVQSTFYGDTNLDGQVNGSDYARVNNGFADGLTGWFNGDFNYDGVVDGSDYALMDNAYNTENPPLDSSPTAQITDIISPVPEPAIAGWLALAAVNFRRVRRDSADPGDRA